jgi:hypothetical protein
MNWKENVRLFLNNQLVRFGNKVGENIEIVTNTPFDEYLLRFFTIQEKCILSQKRKVHKSQEFINNPIYMQYLTEIHIIEQKFMTGEDINPYLSKQIINSEMADNLLSIWNIYHLHISNTKKDTTNYFYDRGEYLIFCIIQGDNVYFIDILPHAYSKANAIWADKNLLQIIENNWQYLIENYKTDLELVFDFDKHERQELQEKHINLPFKYSANVAELLIKITRFFEGCQEKYASKLHLKLAFFNGYLVFTHKNEIVVTTNVPITTFLLP